MTMVEVTREVLNMSPAWRALVRQYSILAFAAVGPMDLSGLTMDEHMALRHWAIAPVARSTETAPPVVRAYFARVGAAASKT